MLPAFISLCVIYSPKKGQRSEYHATYICWKQKKNSKQDTYLILHYATESYLSPKLIIYRALRAKTMFYSSL